jgi:transposase-like protein
MKPARGMKKSQNSTDLYDRYDRVVELPTTEAAQNPGVFPNDESVVKVLYLALHNVTKKWTRLIRDRKAALNQSVLLFGERVPV